MQLMPALLLAAALPAATFVALDMASAATPDDSQALYEQHCQACHGVNRLGGAGPALLPESLSRIKPAEAQGDPRRPPGEPDGRLFTRAE